MEAHTKQLYITPEEYLTFEAQSDSKSEYVDGVIVAMSGCSRQHDAIAATIAGEFYPLLRSSGCRGYTASMRIRAQASNTYYYPDYAISCESPLFEVIHGVDSLLNPTIIFEILSPSTERTDRAEKWHAYRKIDSLTTYVLIHQDTPHIEVFIRNDGSSEWEKTDLTSLNTTLSLPCIGAEIELTRIYANVDFEDVN